MRSKSAINCSGLRSSYFPAKNPTKNLPRIDWQMFDRIDKSSQSGVGQSDPHITTQLGLVTPNQFRRGIRIAYACMAQKGGKFFV